MREFAFIKKEIKLPGVMGMMQPIHLGDTLITLNLLYNRAKILNQEFNVFGPSWIEQLFHIFDYKWLKYEGNYEHTKGDPFVSFSDLMPNNKKGYCNACRCCRRRRSKQPPTYLDSKFCSISNFKPIEYQKFVLPDNKIFPVRFENITYFQFDSRSLHCEHKVPLSRKEAEKVISQFKSHNSKVFGIGGTETKSYMNYSFHLGNLTEIAQNLCNSKKFLGIDSGISHLAGSLKINGEIINIHTQEPMVSELIEMYEIFYPTLKNTKRVDFLKAKACKFLL